MRNNKEKMEKIASLCEEHCLPDIFFRKLADEKLTWNDIQTLLNESENNSSISSNNLDNGIYSKYYNIILIREFLHLKKQEYLKLKMAAALQKVFGKPYLYNSQKIQETTHGTELWRQVYSISTSHFLGIQDSQPILSIAYNYTWNSFNSIHQPHIEINKILISGFIINKSRLPLVYANFSGQTDEEVLNDILHKIIVSIHEEFKNCVKWSPYECIGVEILPGNFMALEKLFHTEFLAYQVKNKFPVIQPETAPSLPLSSHLNTSVFSNKSKRQEISSENRSWKCF